MLVLPALTPVTKPLAEPIVALAVLLLTQVPPGIDEVRLTVELLHTLINPDPDEITGIAFTVTIAVALPKQPKAVVTVYDIVLFPAATPVTIPLVPIVATPVALLLHTPSAVASNNAVVSPTHTVRVPVIAATVGNGLTVTAAVTVVAQPNPIVTV
jgi:hypothetical protein